MKDTISIIDLDKAIAERLDSYSSEVTQRVRKVTTSAIRKLVRKTRERAPKDTGSFAGHIASTYEDGGYTYKGVWYVKDPDYRLTHLLVHGHQLRNGGRTKPNSFLVDSVDEVADEYVKGLEKAVKADD